MRRPFTLPHRSDDPQRGSVSLFVAGVALALLIVIGLAYDGGAKFRAAGDANEYAQQAARTGVQQIDTAQFLATGKVGLNSQAAVDAADAYLQSPALKAEGVTGSAQVTGNTTLLVTVTVTRPTAFLGLINIDTQTVTATATADLLHGVTAPE